MHIVAKTGNKDIATVFIAETDNGKLVEFVESVQPPIPRHEKWVLIISTSYGCPVGCRFCDAGGYYQGKLSKDEIFSQIDYLIKARFPNKDVPVKKFKIQFARMGEPAFNHHVIDVLEELSNLYHAPGLLPTISSIAPRGTDRFFQELLEIKESIYKDKFQLQFSIHTTDIELRDWLMPIKKWDFKKIANYGESFYKKGERKVTLNFALGDNIPVDTNVLRDYFDPDIFFIKITPVNPTYQAVKNNITSQITPNQEKYDTIDALRDANYEVLLSIGEWEESLIGSNCGQHIMNYLRKKKKIERGYTYPLDFQNVKPQLLSTSDNFPTSSFSSSPRKHTDIHRKKNVSV